MGLGPKKIKQQVLAGCATSTLDWRRAFVGDEYFFYLNGSSYFLRIFSHRRLVVDIAFAGEPRPTPKAGLAYS